MGVWKIKIKFKKQMDFQKKNCIQSFRHKMIKISINWIKFKQKKVPNNKT